MGLLGDAIKLNPWGAVAAGIGGLAGLAKTAIGAVQTAKANKQFNKLLKTRPQYEIPKEYSDVLATYNKLSAGKAPGYASQLGQIGQATAKAMQAGREGAISSTAYGDVVTSTLDKELEAIRDLNIRSDEYQMAMTEKAQGAKLGLAGEKASQWNINQYVPWQTEMNRLSEKNITGQQNLFGGIGDFAGQLGNFAGTSAYLDVIKKLYPNNG